MKKKRKRRSKTISICACGEKMKRVNYSLNILWCAQCGRLRHRLNRGFDWRLKKPRNAPDIHPKLKPVNAWPPPPVKETPPPGE